MSPRNIYLIIGIITFLVSCIFFYHSLPDDRLDHASVGDMELGSEGGVDDVASNESYRSRRRVKRVVTEPTPLREFNKYERNLLMELLEPEYKDELMTLAASPKKDRFRLKMLICRAAAERDKHFQYLLSQEGLRDDPWIDIALAGYDYAVNENKDALDHILSIHAKESSGSDSDSVLVLSFINEWDRSIPAINEHFESGADGSAATALDSFWVTREYLYPREFKKYKK